MSEYYCTEDGPLEIGDVTLQTPCQYHGGETGLFWMSYIISHLSSQIDEYEYPGYDHIIAKAMGKRRSVISGQASICWDSRNLLLKEFQAADAKFQNQIVKVILPHNAGNEYNRCRVTAFTLGNVMTHQSRDHYFGLIDFSILSLSPPEEAETEEGGVEF